MTGENVVIVGVDAGGSKTRLIVATDQGENLAELVGPGAAMSPGNADYCADVIAALVASALANVNTNMQENDEDDDEERVGAIVVRALYAGVAGTGREAEQIALQDALARREIADEVVIDTDASISLADAFGDRSGVLLIAGTGSIAYGRSPAGTSARCGGWGPVFGDEGSGAWIGRRALSVVAAAHDGREPETTLTGAILTAAQVNEVEDLLPWAVAADRESIAALAPSVLAMAMQDDVRANSIVDMAVEELVLHVRALARQLFVDDRAAFDLALTGGLLHKGSLLRKRLERRLRAAVPGAAIHPEQVDAARGAVKLALRMATAAR